MKILTHALLATSCAFFALSPSVQAKPKYASDTVRAIDSNNYLKENTAPDFWNLIFHYVPQGENMCQTASMAVVFNALRNSEALDSETMNITQKEIVKKINDAAWVKAMKDHKCYSMDKFADVLRKGLAIYFKDKYSVRVVHVDSTDEKSVEKFMKDFVKNEESAKDLIIANFDQAIFTGEVEAAGHISPIAAYDAKMKKFLILDVDRDWYTPYWVTQANFFKGLATIDQGANQARGYVVIEPAH
jgi:hypothetical protein